MRDVIALLHTGRPVLVVPIVPERKPTWMSGYRVTGFVLSDGETVLRTTAHAAPFIANAFPQLTVIALGAEVLQWFDRHAASTPQRYVDLLQLARIAAASAVSVTPPAGDIRLTLGEAPDAAFLDLWRVAEDLKAAFAVDAKAYAPFADQYLKATTLLDLMAGRGYHVGDGYRMFAAEDGLVHPTWTVPAFPGRITTQMPPLHGVPRRHWDTLRARPGHRWVRIAWPGLVTAIAKRLVPAAEDVVPTAVTDWVLGAHHVSEPTDSEALPREVEQRVHALRDAWAAEARVALFPVPLPGADDPTVPLSPGKRALLATATFTVTQLSAMHDGALLLRHRGLLGLHDVIPGLGSLLFQIDDRVPLWALQQYVDAFHGHVVAPEVTLGTHWGSMVPLDHPYAEVALQLERPTQMPVQCPLCLGVADSARDLATHFIEDHAHVR